jgi:hypothetical protein
MCLISLQHMRNELCIIPLRFGSPVLLLYRFGIVRATLKNKETSDGFVPHARNRFYLLVLGIIRLYRLCSLVVRVPGNRSRYPEFDSRRYQIF